MGSAGKVEDTDEVPAMLKSGKSPEELEKIYEERKRQLTKTTSSG